MFSRLAVVTTATSSAAPQPGIAQDPAFSGPQAAPAPAVNNSSASPAPLPAQAPRTRLPAQPHAVGLGSDPGCIGSGEVPSVHILLQQLGSYRTFLRFAEEIGDLSSNASCQEDYQLMGAMDVSNEVDCTKQHLCSRNHSDFRWSSMRQRHRLEIVVLALDTSTAVEFPRSTLPRQREVCLGAEGAVARCRPAGPLAKSAGLSHSLCTHRTGVRGLSSHSKQHGEAQPGPHQLCQLGQKGHRQHQGIHPGVGPILKFCYPKPQDLDCIPQLKLPNCQSEKKKNCFGRARSSWGLGCFISAPRWQLLHCRGLSFLPFGCCQPKKSLCVSADGLICIEST